MSAIDRAVVAAIVFMYAAIPLYGTFAVFDPLRVAMPVIVPGQIAIGIGALMLIAASLCVWGAFRRPAPRRIVIAQLLAGGGTTVAALLGFDPGTGLKLGIIVLAMGAVGIATYGYSALPGVTRAIVIAVLASGTLASLVAFAMLLTRTPAALYAYNNGRAVGIFLNPNELAAYLLVVLGLAAARRRRTRLRDDLLALGISRRGLRRADLRDRGRPPAHLDRPWRHRRRGRTAADRPRAGTAPQSARRHGALSGLGQRHPHGTGVPVQRHRAARVPPHVRRRAPAGRARRRSAGGVRSA